MREVDRRTTGQPRGFLRGSATAVPAAAIAAAGMSIGARSAWAQDANDAEAAHDGDAGADGARHLSARPARRLLLHQGGRRL